MDHFVSTLRAEVGATCPSIYWLLFDAGIHGFSTIAKGGIRYHNNFEEKLFLTRIRSAYLIAALITVQITELLILMTLSGLLHVQLRICQKQKQQTLPFLMVQNALDEATSDVIKRCSDYAA
jgi:hypothetical protein